ncbi:STAS domain-containing protein [Bacteriovorax sp. DB6_IX]|uniref:STAS domain-containing protein n=1 Tax=Bacteriovorax sp. DB6_IX TaxID=1353530 RepID=UPI00038A14DD|nr:STAS domain-containing protein [Bacteriovorax sp. DB6_IX]EQC51419.1 STAS domain protein [Bacteriovorax sp. DB6_IX]
MTMKARVTTDATGNITVLMEGGMDYENIVPLKQELASLTSKYPSSQIILDMTSLNFVGSSGIGVFVDTIRALNNRKDQIRLSNVSSEFFKVFKLYNFDAMEVLINEFDSDVTELSNYYGSKGRTFQN